MENQQRNFGTWQLTSITINSMIGVGLLTIPRSSTVLLHQMGWLGLLTGVLVVFVAVASIVYLGNQFSGLTCVEFMPQIFGAVPGGVCVFLFILYQLFNAGMVARLFGEVIVTSVLPNTPLEVIVVTLLLLVIFLCCHEIETLARVNELLIPFLLLPSVLIPLVSFLNAEWNNLLPVHVESWKHVVKTGLDTYSVFTGYELLMVYFAFSIPGARLRMASFTGVSIVFVVYVITVIAGIAVFGYEELQRMVWPSLELVKVTQRAGWFLERFESAYLAIWVASVFTSIGNMFYATVFSLRRWLRKGIRFQRISAIVIIVPLFYLLLVPQNIVELFAYSDLLIKMGYIVTIIIPVLLAITQFIRNKIHKAREVNNEKGGT
ncbi:endospore germination permease [Brevibacillus formosus]|uniref:GerAB/ArcD/ProY family transporter n=1 Tax=Brevibacillus formosus TaxID=54913 RepID=UPI0018CEC059|nr:endospore germination permease [Brevibacillus formosus]MBG9944106.1 spore gernimation protein [Brevibacillus formosus]MBW5468182.1 endospore germination permease [Brevibacillus formosus]